MTDEQALFRFGILFAIVLLGSGIGFYVQLVMTLIIANGQYKRLSRRRLSGLRLGGQAAALAAGISFMATQGDLAPTVAVWRCWFVQIAAGVAGVTYLRHLIPKNDQKEESND